MSGFAARSRFGVSGFSFRLFGWIVVVALLVAALAGPSSGGVLAVNAPGNNGTVKIHEGDTETEPGPQNEPHVCTFHVHGFFFDPEETGDWWILSWPPTGDGSEVESGSWHADAAGEWRSDLIGLPDGHYRLVWDIDDDASERNEGGPTADKHKVFWVDCEGDVVGETGSPTAPPTTAPPTEAPPTTAPPTTAPPTEAPPSGDVAPTESAMPTESPSEAPTGGVGGETGTPSITLPPTDTPAGGSGPTSDSWRLLLLAIAAILGALLVLTPGPRRAAHSEVRRR